MNGYVYSSLRSCREGDPLSTAAAAAVLAESISTLIGESVRT